MRQETRLMLRAMEDWPWFEHIGEPIKDPRVIAVASWDEAIEPHRSYVWECLRLQVKNRISIVLNERDWHRAQRWNPMTDEVKQVMMPLFDRIRELGSRLSLSENVFYHQVRWDLLGICMETEYADIFPPLFNVPVLAPWYQAGHFPCGWDGPVLDTRWNGEFQHYHLYIF